MATPTATTVRNPSYGDGLHIRHGAGARGGRFTKRPYGVRAYKKRPVVLRRRDGTPGHGDGIMLDDARTTRRLTMDR